MLKIPYEIFLENISLIVSRDINLCLDQFGSVLHNDKMKMNVINILNMHAAFIKYRHTQ